MGTPEFAVPSLRALLDRGENVVCVVTQPDRPRGRGSQRKNGEMVIHGTDGGAAVMSDLEKAPKASASLPVPPGTAGGYQVGCKRVLGPCKRPCRLYKP